jgi:hypothetical protein
MKRSSTMPAKANVDEQEKAATVIQSRVRQNKAKQVATEKKKTSTKAPDPLSTSALYNVLAVDKGAKFARLVTPAAIRRLYEATLMDGFTDDALAFFSAGNVWVRLHGKEVEEMAAGFARVANDRLGREELEAFMEKLAEALGIDVGLLVRVFRQTEEDQQPGGEELVRKFFAARQKNYMYGSTFRASDWVVVCRACGWLSPGGCNQGDAGQIFQLVFKMENKEKKEADSAKGPADAKAIWKDSSFAALVEGISRRLQVPPLQVIRDLWRVAKTYEDKLKDVIYVNAVMAVTSQPGTAGAA